jgi:alginate O-acetyltransferase complex protein AlgI
VFELAPSELYTSYAWIGVIAYAFQIYFDFSGYSDMAIGLGRMMGFEFLENFNFPYISQNITEFWRRWHISLSRWMREYLYIPLGGNRVSPLRMYFNLWVVFLLSGLWHGASWSFVIWGAYHGLFLAIDKLFWLDFSKRLPALVNTMLCFVVVLIGWVFFRVEDASEACSFIGVMFGFDQLVQPTSVYPAQIIHNRGIVIFTIAAIGCMLPVFQNLKKRSLDVWSRLPIAVRTQCAFLFAVCCVLLSVTALSASRFSPFLYFRF